MGRKVGRKLHVKLNICLRPTANMHYEGKTQRIMKGDFYLFYREILEREVNWTSFAW